MELQDHPSLKKYVARNPRASTLRQIVEDNFRPYFEELESVTGRGPRRYVVREFEKFLECRILDHGMMRSECTNSNCTYEQVTPFSCKGRGFCGSCGGRRMVETALNLTSSVLPHVRYRQFVLSLPIALRYMCAIDAKLLRKVHQIASSEYMAFYRDGRDPEDGASGGISFYQRFGSSCNFNLHFHTLMVDGVWLRNSRGELHFFNKSLCEKELARVLRGITTRVICYLRRHGYLSRDGETITPGVLEEESDLIHAFSVSKGGRRKFADGVGSLTRIGRGFGYEQEVAVSSKKMTVTLNGFSLHAGTVVNSSSRERLYELIEYQCRPPVSDSRLRILEDDSVELKLKTAYSDGTTKIHMTGVQMMARLHALIPPPLANQRIYFGVFGAAHNLRSEIVAKAKAASTRRRHEPSELLSSTLWAEFMAKTFKLDIGKCPCCTSPMRILSFITKGKEIFRYLTHTNGFQRDPPVRVKLAKEIQSSEEFSG